MVKNSGLSLLEKHIVSLLNRVAIPDNVPVDVAANQLIAVAWHVGQSADSGERHVGQSADSGERHVGQSADSGERHVGQSADSGKRCKVPVFNCTMSSTNPFSSGDYEIVGHRYGCQMVKTFPLKPHHIEFNDIST